MAGKAQIIKLGVATAVWLLMTPWAHAAGRDSIGPSRVDFDERLVRGQRNNAGGIYIFARQSIELKDMVQKPKSYRQRIIKTVFGD